jgi:4-hydroxy-3-methylbut-2-enyl diphosphate reductase
VLEKSVTLCLPNGFCAGVERAVKMVELALERFGAPLYVHHEIVHNRYVVDQFRDQGVVFVDDLALVPSGSKLIFSAHGVSPEVRKKAEQAQLEVLDATCPLVTKVHIEAIRFARMGYRIFLIGHRDHVEVVGTLGESPEAIVVIEPRKPEEIAAQVAALPDERPRPMVYLTQTTLNVDDCLAVVRALRERFPELESPPKDDICYATTNRQEAVKALAPKVDFFLVLGSGNSSNSKRLVEVARQCGCEAELFENLEQVKAFDWSPWGPLGVTAGASTPDHFVQAVLAYLATETFVRRPDFLYAEEDVVFKMPRGLGV